jgi:hypothetical protein
MAMDPADYRPLAASERALLERLLEPRFPGRDELRAQLDHLAARPLDDEGCLDLECRGGPRAEVKHSIPTEGEGPDVDGAILHVQLHVEGGFMRALTMWSESTTKPKGLPAARGLKVFAAFSEDAGVWNSDPKFL